MTAIAVGFGGSKTAGQRPSLASELIIVVVAERVKATQKLPYDLAGTLQRFAVKELA